MSKALKKAIAPNAKQPVAKAIKTKEVKKPVKDTKLTTAETGKRKAGSKQSILIALLERPTGATVDDMTKATGWQGHSVLGAISGVLRKRLKLTVESIVESRGRVYRITGSR